MATKVGFGSVLDQLMNMGDWEPMKIPDDKHEPVFLTENEWQMRDMHRSLQIQERMDASEISKAYAKREAILWPGEENGPEVFLEDINREDSYILRLAKTHPLVMTFKHEAIERELEKKAAQGLIVLPIYLPNGEVSRDWKDTKEAIEKIRKQIIITKPEDAVAVHDMPEACLDGWLGDLCHERLGHFPIAYAWPALLAVASTMVPHSANEHERCNINVCAVGPKGSGKTQSFDWAGHVLGVPVEVLKSGSAEGLAKKIGDKGGASILWFTDELDHLCSRLKSRGQLFRA
jgi:hypothetical protein